MGYYCMQAIFEGDAPPGSGELTWKFLATTPLWDTDQPGDGETFLCQASRSPGCLIAWLEGVADNVAWFGESPWDQLAACWEQQDLVGFLNVLGHELSAWAVWCAPHLLQHAWPDNPEAGPPVPPTAEELDAFARAASRLLTAAASPADYAALSPRLNEWAGPHLPGSLEDGLQQLGFVRVGELWWRRQRQPLFFPEQEEM